MTRKSHGLAVLLFALFAVATCGVLFAQPRPAAAEPCGQNHVWAPAKPATEGLTATIANATAMPSDRLHLLGPDTPTWIGAPEPANSRPGVALAEPPAPRAPPLA